MWGSESPQGALLVFIPRSNHVEEAPFCSGLHHAYLARGIPRTGHEHVYTINGSRLRDLLVDGQWVTVSVSDPVAQRVAA